jgi:hypothetical protein
MNLSFDAMNISSDSSVDRGLFAAGVSTICSPVGFSGRNGNENSQLLSGVFSDEISLSSEYARTIIPEHNLCVADATAVHNEPGEESWYTKRGPSVEQIPVGGMNLAHEEQGGSSFAAVTAVHSQPDEEGWYTIRRLA